MENKKKIKKYINRIHEITKMMSGIAHTKYTFVIARKFAEVEDSKFTEFNHDYYKLHRG